MSLSESQACLYVFSPEEGSHRGRSKPLSIPVPGGRTPSHTCGVHASIIGFTRPREINTAKQLRNNISLHNRLPDQKTPASDSFNHYMFIIR
jgi:hypothetical protein